MDIRLTEAEKQTAYDLLCDLVNIPSPYFQEEAIFTYVQEYLSQAGMETNLTPYYFAPLKYSGQNLWGELGSGPGHYIYLGGHLDTVNVAAGWTKPPLKATLEEDKLYGTGVLDMKAGCAAIIIALKKFTHNYPNFSGRILYHFASVEEGPYGLGTTFFLKDVLKEKPDFAIITEPSSALAETDRLTIALGALGGYNYQVELIGASAHAATPDQGLSAVDEGAQLVQALNRIETLHHPVLGQAASCVIAFHGGSGACSVPDQAVVEVFRHCVPGETIDTIRSEVEAVIKELSLKCHTKITFRDQPTEGFDGGFAPYYIPQTNPFVTTLSQVIQKSTNEDPLYSFSKANGDFNLLGGNFGIDTVLFGPAGKNLHQADEYVELSSYYQVIEQLYAFLVETLT